jgi:hypothetical protein
MRRDGAGILNSEIVRKGLPEMTSEQSSEGDEEDNICSR